ncbi:MAG: Gx transporter family protein [Caldisericia bacterium]|nr:Gx transporter family protein [Caldisericia bacterium]MDD4614449.1 Gx transporter family protein [Caldisericia bacterium]
MQKITVRKITTFSFLLGIGIILHVFEIYISVPIGGYMLKPGISNIVVLLCMYLLSFHDAVFLAFSRGLLSGLFEPSLNGITICITFGGIVLSLIGMGFFHMLRSQRIVTISIAGAIAHNIGQLIVVLFFIPDKYLLYYLPLLIISGFFGGLITGWIVTLSLPKIKQPVT